MSTSQIDLNPDSLSSFHTLEVAFNSLKERYDRQSKRLNDLERENLNLRTSKSDLYKEVKTLTDSNLQLREKNLRLNQRLHRQSVEAVEVRDQLNSLQEDHTDSLRKLGLLQREIDEAAVSNPSSEFSASNPNVRLQRVEDDDEGRTPADSLDVDRKTRPDKSEDIQIDDIRLIVLKEDSNRDDESLSVSQSQMNEIKSRLLDQREMLKKSILNLKRKREESLVLLQEEMAKRKTEETLADSLNEITESLSQEEDDSSSTTRKCPMCEVGFDKEETSMEIFEEHVLEHFRYEEEDTLRNYEIPSPNEFPSA